jgi:lipoate---protein ligase
MIHRLDYKIPGGKLLRVSVDVDEGIATRVRIAGDFFAHPEALFDEAEAALSGLPASTLAEAALESFSRPGLSLYGVAPVDIAESLRLALGPVAG